MAATISPVAATIAWAQRLVLASMEPSHFQTDHKAVWEPTIKISDATRIASGDDEDWQEEVSRMAGRTHLKQRSVVAQRQECCGRHVDD